jgi:formamidopyrimidine-DNA glycosylase
MPELPEAETIVRGLKPRILHCIIASIDFPPAKYFRPQFVEPLECYLGGRITNIFRHGKSVVIEIRASDKSTIFILIRLGMTGKLLIDYPPDRHTHAFFHLQNPLGTLAFRDTRQFGRILFLKDWRVAFEQTSWSSKRGSAFHRRSLHEEPVSSPTLIADPLSTSPEVFLRLFWKRRGMIKAALMSQKLLVGIGNIYADESLFTARIHPRQNLHRLSRRRLLAYFSALQKILRSAIELGGSSISDFVSPDNYPGEFQMEHQAYGREGERCRRRHCPGVIRRTTVASRSTYYCSVCQKIV